MAKLSLDQAYLIKIEAQLPNGEVSLWELLPKIEKYQVSRLRETINYRNNGSDIPESIEILLWISQQDYQPLANRLGKLGIHPKPTVTRFAPF